MRRARTRRLSGLAIGASLTLWAAAAAQAGYTELPAAGMTAGVGAEPGPDSSQSEALRAAHVRIEELERQLREARADADRKQARQPVAFLGPQSFTPEGQPRLAFVTPPSAKEAASTGQPALGLAVGDSGMRLFFDQGSTQVRLDSAEADALVAAANGAVRIVLRGRTDSTGSIAGNATVARKRAEAVRDLLVARGVAPERIQVLAQPLSGYLGDNQTVLGRAQNRRVDIALEG